MEDIFMTDPPPESLMASMAYFIPKNVPFRQTSITLSQSSSVVSGVFAAIPTPALLTITSRPSHSSTARQRLDLPFPGDIGLVDQRVLFEFGGNFPGALLVQVCDHDSRTFPGHAQRDGPPYPRAGDNDALVLQAPYQISPCIIFLHPHYP